MKRAILSVTALLAVLSTLHAAPVVIARPSAVAAVRLAPVLTETVRLDELNKLQAARNLNPSDRAAGMREFQKLSPALQERVLAAAGSPVAGSISELLPLTLRPVEFVRIRPELLKTYLARILPADGAAPGEYAFAEGSTLKPTSKILVDDALTASAYLNIPGILGPCVAFEIPGGLTRGTSHQVKAQNGGLFTEPYTYKVVAPRGYRGHYGWKFANFGAATIPWEMYRNFFGAAAVQYGDGTHRPGAQLWYDTAYKGVGNGGNCYGMSVASLRHRVTGGISTYWHSWFAAPAHHQPWVWKYDYTTETKQTVQEDQGGQLSAEMAAVINALKAVHTPQVMYSYVEGATPATKLPVLGMWGNGGHAIVAYGTKAVGNDRQLLCYDNNAPYKENETGAADPTIAHVNWSANTFSYGSYYKAIAMPYDSCVAPPHLPAGYASTMGDAADNTAIAVLSPGARVAQITDENGRRFFNADGTENTDPQTRIPNASQFVPLTGAPPRADDPLIFVFGAARAKSLSFQLQGPARGLSLFQPGLAMQAELGGGGTVQFTDLLTPTRGLLLLNPGQLQPTRLQVIRSQEAGDRTFELLNLRNLSGPSLKLLPAVDGASLEVQSAAAAGFDARVSGPAGRGASRASFTGLATTAASRALLRPANWQDLTRGVLNLQLRNLQGNQLQQQLQLRPR